MTTGPVTHSFMDPRLKFVDLQTILSRWPNKSFTASSTKSRQMTVLVLPSAQGFVQHSGSATYRKGSDRSMARSQARSSAVLRHVVAVLLCVMLFTMDSFADAAPLNVGGGAGWTVQHNYGHMTARRGDVLKFNYNSRFHNVLQVTQNEYNKCLVPSKPIKQYTSGRDSISLNKPETYFFMCGFPGHCTGGMKVAVTVH